MERHRKLDAACRASILRALILCVLLLCFASASAQIPSFRAQHAPACAVEGRAVRSLDPPILRASDLLQQGQDLQQLLDQKRWNEVVEIVRTLPNRTADIDFIYGTALANLGRWSEARYAFSAGCKLAPKDPRFPEELAGVAFKQSHHSDAKRWLSVALRLNPHDDYANDFLGTLYFLDGNLEAALKYWNRVNKPVLQNVRTEPELRLDPVLLDRAFAFAPASVMTRSQLLASEARLRALRVFPQFNLQLEARSDGKFDAALHATELDGFGKDKWSALLYTFRGVFFETVTPEYSNLHGEAINIDSLFRWDKNKRRAVAGISGPLRRDPRWRWHFFADLRNENWALGNFSALSFPSLGNLNLRRESATAEIASYRSGTWNWSTGGEFSHRDFRSLAVNSALPQNLFEDGNELKHFARINYDLLRIPEHRFFLTTSASSEEGRLWSAEDSAFTKLQFSSSQHWFPRATSDDYEMQGSVSYGHTFGAVPFDELFMLGIERDNNLMLRAHVGTSDGKKGSAPLGRDYFLSNWEIDKQLYDGGLFRVTLGPFLDTGKTTDPDAALGSRKWLYDTGAQLKLRVLGVGFAFVYGKDLRSGNNAFYVYLTR